MDPSKVPNPPTPQQAEAFNLPEEEYWQRLCDMLREFVLFYHSPGRTVAVTWPPPGVPEGDFPGQAGLVHLYGAGLKIEYEKVGWTVDFDYKEHLIKISLKKEPDLTLSKGGSELPG